MLATAAIAGSNTKSTGGDVTASDARRVAEIQGWLANALAGDMQSLATLQVCYTFPSSPAEKAAAKSALDTYADNAGRFNADGLHTNASLSDALREIVQPSLDRLAQATKQVGQTASNSLAQQISPSSQTPAGQVKLVAAQVPAWAITLIIVLAAVGTIAVFARGTGAAPSLKV